MELWKGSRNESDPNTRKSLERVQSETGWGLTQKARPMS